jgi:hypothetical protein
MVPRRDKKQPVVPGSETHFLKPLQTLQISSAGLSEAVKGVENPHRGRLVKNADIGSRLIGPNDPLQAGS